MKAKRVLCALMTCAAILGCFSSNARAVQVDTDVPLEFVMDIGITRASGSFSMSVPANSSVLADSSFPLAAGETVRINASYAPDASMDFGLVDPNGRYHYFTVTNGSIDKTIRVDESGNYTLRVRNNSAGEVKVSGFVKY